MLTSTLKPSPARSELSVFGATSPLARILEKVALPGDSGRLFWRAGTGLDAPKPASLTWEGAGHWARVKTGFFWPCSPRPPGGPIAR
jgi:hypothetical protein